MTTKPKGHLTLYICVAIVAAIVLALVAPHFSTSLHVGGEIFLRLLKMMVVPLVMSSVMSGILGLGDVRKLGRPGGCAVLYYFTTTVLAVVVGLVVVNVIRPGDGTVDQAVIDEIEGGGKTGDAAERIRDAIASAAGVDPDEVAEVM